MNAFLLIKSQIGIEHMSLSVLVCAYLNLCLVTPLRYMNFYATSMIWGSRLIMDNIKNNCM